MHAGNLTAKAFSPLVTPPVLSAMIQNLVKETNFELQRGKLQCTSGDWSHWSGSTNLALVRITNSMYLLVYWNLSCPETKNPIPFSKLPIPFPVIKSQPQCGKSHFPSPKKANPSSYFTPSPPSFDILPHSLVSDFPLVYIYSWANGKYINSTL